MNTYFSTFIVGFEKVVEKNLPLIIKKIKIVKLLDGLVFYKTDAAVNEIKNIRFFNNSFVLIRSFDKTSLVDALLNLMLDRKLVERIKKDLKSLGSTFRIVVSNKNQIISIDETNLQELERLLSDGLKLDKANPSGELWFIKRSEGQIFIGVRITRPNIVDKHLQKGELRPELAHFLCLLSDPSEEDVFLDPFAGSGAIVIERAANFPYKKIFAGEKDKQIFRKLKDRIKENKLDITLGKWNATNLSALTDGSINKIVTDPPWGIYQKAGEDLEEFYVKMLKEFLRVLGIGGIAIILMGQKEIFEEAMLQISGFKLLEKYDILVSGKKAGVYKIIKK